MTMMNYERANASLTGRCQAQRKVDHNTWLIRREDHIALRLHNTDILMYRADGSVEYFAGKWQTWTTKDRFNKFGPLSIWSERRVWFVGRRSSDDRKTFADGMRVLADGTIEGAGDDPKAQVRERSQIKKWCARYMDALVAGKVPAPGPGDCWFCSFIEEKTGCAWGELSQETRDAQGGFSQDNHIRSHMKEGYFVPSLLRNALKTFGASQSMYWR